MSNSVVHDRIVLRWDTALLAEPAAIFSSDAGGSLADRVSDLSDLAALYLKGARHLVMRRFGSSSDDASAVKRLKRTCVDLNGILTSRELDPVTLKTVTQGHPAFKLIAETFATPQDTGRRRFLSRVTAEAHVEEDISPLDALAQLQGINTPNAAYAAVPRIDPGKCTGCDACVRLCPHEALTLINASNDKLMYQIQPEMCSGCGLCEDICDPKAIEVLSLSGASENVELHAGQCRACGVPYHEPVLHHEEVCVICRVTNHHKNLFQTLN